MAYTPTVWENDVTEVDEDNMNHIEEGIGNNDSAIEQLDEEIEQLQNFIARTPYTFTPVYTNYNPGYELYKVGNIVIFAVNSIFLSSINANEWTIVGSIPEEISPTNSSITAVTTVSSGSTGDILGYGRTDILTNGNIRVKSTTANSGLTFFSFIAMWTV